MTHRSQASSGREGLRVLVAHPSNDLYGADRMLLRSSRALLDAGCRVTVVLPARGALWAALEQDGMSVVECRMPVLRKGALSPRGLIALAVLAVRSLPRQVRLVRRADAVYVNTVTVPTWVLVARLLRRRVVVHVREAEDAVHPFLRRVLVAPLRLADLAVCNSRATEAFARGVPGSARVRTLVIHNGFELPPRAEPRPRWGTPLRLAVVGRLSPRKGQDVAVAAMSLLSARGLKTSLVLAGDVFPGYEWYAEELRVAAAGLDVVFLGFVDDPSVVYQAADVVLVPSRTEPFGNVAVEAIGAARPVVASAVQGLVEVLEAGGGLLVEPGDPDAIASAVASLVALSEEERAALVTAGRAQALQRFSPGRYNEELVAAVTGRASETGAR